MNLNEGDEEISINSHFDYFGSRSGEEIVTLSNNAICKPNNDPYIMTSHFSSGSLPTNMVFQLLLLLKTL